MRKIQLACLAALLSAGVVHAAAVPCNGFEIKIKNKTADDLLISKISLRGADIQPESMELLKANSEQIFTVNNSSENKDMEGKLELHSASLPSKKTTISFNLKNKSVYCEHDDKGSSSDYPLDKTRLPGHVTYTVG